MNQAASAFCTVLFVYVVGEYCIPFLTKEIQKNQKRVADSNAAFIIAYRQAYAQWGIKDNELFDRLYQSGPIGKEERDAILKEMKMNDESLYLVSNKSYL